MNIVLPLLALLCTATAAWPAAAAEPVIGNVVRLQGPGTGTSEGVTETLAPGKAVRLNEIVATGADARLELAFADGSRLAVGENAAVVLDRFVYAPAGAGALHAAVTGPFRFVSGKLAAGASRQASVTTPYALIGIRGTEFWGGPIDGAFGIFLIEGEISIQAGGRETVLTAAGSGVNIDGANAAPGDTTIWPADKVARAVATVTFR